MKKKVIHLIYICYYNECYSVCIDCDVTPIEDTLDFYNYKKRTSKGTFDAKKVTCKRCLEHPKYKEVVDKINHPLLYWRERV